MSKDCGLKDTTSVTEIKMDQKTGYIRNGYGEVIEVVFNDVHGWIYKSIYDSDAEIFQVKGSVVYDTPAEAVNGRVKKIKRFSNKKNNFNTFIEKTSTKEKGD